MIFIEKNPESPKGLEDWKEQENERLQTLYRSNSNAAWAHLPSNLPAFPDPNFVYYSKFELKDELLTEQKFICAYCMDRLKHDHTCTIDHLIPKSKGPERWTFDYSNLLASCSGAEPQDEKGRKQNEKNRHCNNKKEENVIHLSPLMEKVNEKFIYTEDGQILGNDEDSEVTIKLLGLDCRKLQIARRNAIRSVLYNDPPDDTQHISRMEMLIRLQEILDQGKIKTPFWGAKEFILKLYLNL